MRNKFLLNSKFYSFFIFLILEIISFVLIINYNNKQKDIFLYSSNLFAGHINKKYSGMIRYFKLKDVNRALKKENARLLEQSFNNKNKNYVDYHGEDTLSLKDYTIIPATVCNKSIDKRTNRITLDRGFDAGIEEGMGVIDAHGIVGVVRKVNSDFASVIPLHNTISRTSVAVKNKGYFGILQWQPYDYRRTVLTSIPKHANVAEGDSIITSGFSTIFPRGIFVGTIEKINLDKGSNYFNIIVKLNNDLALVDDVYVIKNNKKDKKLEVEKN